MATDGGSETLVGLTPREELVEVLQALKDRQLDPRHVFVDGEVLGAWSGDDAPVALVDVGHTHTVVSVASEGQVRAVRSLDVAGLAFTQALQGALGLEYAAAQALKHEGGELPPAAQDALDAAV
jgi:Tfp pilus assembly PilM family ATPase